MTIFLGGGHDFFLLGFRGSIENFSRFEKRYGGGGHKKFHKNRHHQFIHI